MVAPVAILILLSLFVRLTHSDTNRYDPADYENIQRPIRIGLSIDDHSFKDLAILVNSIIESALEPRDVIFNIAAVGIDMKGSKMLQHSIESTMKNCFPDARAEVVAFNLPEGSGFAKQLQKLKQKSHHWNSASGADMVRFFLPQIFPHAERILYIDNDIVVTCCVEGIWSTDFDESQIVGIALDDLNWATVTQFRRHYNASHPLVIKNMRRNQPADAQEKKATLSITEKEFSAALPKYPNDGVLLIDVRKYNERKVLETMDEIAMANAIGEYAVNLGTQQFTVLALFDRWKELTPRANMRHSPDMARGYLMWFYYNGFIHYAGQTKPRAMCHSTTAENAKKRLPYLRVMSYAAWAISNYQVALKCPNDQFAYAVDCTRHVKPTPTGPDLLHLVDQVLAVSKDPSLLYLRIGPIHGDLSRSLHEQLLSEAAAMSWKDIQSGETGSARFHDAKLNQSTWEVASKYFKLGVASELKGFDLIEVLDRIAIHDSSYSVRVFDHKTQRIEHSRCTLQLAAGLSAEEINPPKLGSASDANSKRGRRGPPPRTFRVHLKHLCDKIIPRYQFAYFSGNQSTEKAFSQNGEDSFTHESHDSAVAPPPCVDLLQDLKAEGRKHWEAQMIVIDVNTPHSGRSEGNTTTPRSGPMISTDSKLNNKQLARNMVFTRSSTLSSKHTSLGVLLNLDLVFMRPKFFLVRLAGSSEGRLQHDIEVAKSHLRKQGYLAYHHRGKQCGESWTATHATRTALIQYACVWGSRVTEFEFFEDLL